MAVVGLPKAVGALWAMALWAVVVLTSGAAAVGSTWAMVVAAAAVAAAAAARLSSGLCADDRRGRVSRRHSAGLHEPFAQVAQVAEVPVLEVAPVSVVAPVLVVAPMLVVVPVLVMAPVLVVAVCCAAAAEGLRALLPVRRCLLLPPSRGRPRRGQ